VAARLDKPAETIRVMSAATRLEPDNADYLYLLGVAQLWTGDTENATVPLARASELSPDSVRTHLALGAALHALTQDDKAVDPLKRALALDPTNSEASYLMADICQTKGDLATAERLVDSVLSRNPKHAGANLVRGVVLFKKGDPEGSRKALELAATSDPGDPRVYSQLSRVYTQLGDPAKAAEAEHNFQTANRRSKQSNHELRQLLEFATPATGKK
jgi:predicted Zn-dependent protease